MFSVLQKKGKFFFIVILILILTLLRENIFLELNAIIQNENYNKAYFYFFDNFFKQFSISTLKILKWILTGLFAVSVAFLSILGIDLWFKERSFKIIFIKMYLFMFLFVLFVGVIAFTFDSYERCYFVVRKVFGLFQSPIPLLLMFTIFYYLRKEDKL